MTNDYDDETEICVDDAIEDAHVQLQKTSLVEEELRFHLKLYMWMSTGGAVIGLMVAMLPLAILTGLLSDPGKLDKEELAILFGVGLMMVGGILTLGVPAMLSASKHLVQVKMVRAGLTKSLERAERDVAKPSLSAKPS